MSSVVINLIFIAAPSQILIAANLSSIIFGAIISILMACGTSKIPEGSKKRINRRIVSAAILMEDGLIIVGIRHYSPDMRATMKRVYGDKYHLKEKEQGFVDQMGVFLTREDAWKIAEKEGQIIRNVAPYGTLYSENLY